MKKEYGEKEENLLDSVGISPKTTALFYANTIVSTLELRLSTRKSDYRLDAPFHFLLNKTWVTQDAQLRGQ
jgi:hypothetical protein